MLTVDHLNQYFGGSHILRDISLSLEAGKVTALMGRNGVGKTTLLKSVLGLLTVHSGSTHLNEVRLDGLSTQARVMLGIGYVPQGRMIFPLLTVEENLRVAEAANPEANARDPAIFDYFPVLAEMLHRRGGDLSGGQQQQLAIARALVTRPRLLVLDEPCEGIQPSVVSEIAAVICALRNQGMTVLLVEQRLKFVRATADHFAIMDRGKIKASGPIDALSDAQISQYLTV